MCAALLVFLIADTTEWSQRGAWAKLIFSALACIGVHGKSSPVE